MASRALLPSLTPPLQLQSLRADVRFVIPDRPCRPQASEAHVASATAERDAAVQSDKERCRAEAAADASAEAEALRSSCWCVEQRPR
jgi:hypothetical protein